MQSIGDDPTRLPLRFGALRLAPVRHDSWLVTDASDELALANNDRVAVYAHETRLSLRYVYVIAPIFGLFALINFVIVRRRRGESFLQMFGLARRPSNKFE